MQGVQAHSLQKKGKIIQDIQHTFPFPKPCKRQWPRFTFRCDTQIQRPMEVTKFSELPKGKDYGPMPASILPQVTPMERTCVRSLESPQTQVLCLGKPSIGLQILCATQGEDNSVLQCWQIFLSFNKCKECKNNVTKCC